MRLKEQFSEEELQRIDCNLEKLKEKKENVDATSRFRAEQTAKGLLITISEIFANDVYCKNYDELVVEIPKKAQNVIVFNSGTYNETTEIKLLNNKAVVMSLRAFVYKPVTLLTLQNLAELLKELGEFEMQLFEDSLSIKIKK